MKTFILSGYNMKVYMDASRRELLKSSAVAASIGFVGYSSGRASAFSEDGSTTRENNNEMSAEIRLELESVSPPQSEREFIDPIVFSERSEPEQKKLKEAIETARSTDQIGNESNATKKIREAIEERNNDDPQVFIKRGNSYFSTRFVAGEHIVANPDENISNNSSNS